MANRPRHRVSCKVAIYSPDGQSVLLMEYVASRDKSWGLPGGHLEYGESLEAAVHREMLEEIGTDPTQGLAKKEFWRRDDGKIVLAFTARAATMELPEPPRPKRERAGWVRIEHIATLPLGDYMPFIMRYQPQR